MQVLVSLIISALMVLGSISYVQEKNGSLGANQKISELTAMTSIDDADTIPVVDNSGTPTTKKITWANATSSLQTWYDGRYQTILTNSAGLRSALSDETGTGLAVFGTTPTLTTPILNSATITTPYINVSGTEAAGDLLYLSDNGGTLSRLAVGTNGNLLTVSSGIPSWTDVSTGNTTFGFIRTGGLLSTASSTIYGLTVGSTLAATTTNNLVVENNASTTNLYVDRSIKLNTGSQMIGFASSTNYEIVTGTFTGPTTAGNSNHVTGSVSCTGTKKVLGGGVYNTSVGTNGSQSVEGTRPNSTYTGWDSSVVTTANGGTGGTWTVYAICITP